MTRDGALEAAITARLRTGRFGRPLLAYDRATSTNDVARHLAGRGEGEGTAVLAREQTAGRGRLGRPWRSPPGGLYLSAVLRPSVATASWPLLGLAVAVGAADGAEAAAGAPITLKWPNDLLLDGRKVGGVLVEAAEGWAVAGIGINVGIPPALHGEAAALDVDLPALAVEVLSGMERAVDLLYADPASVLIRWRARSATLGRRVRVVGGAEVLEGIAEDIEADGALVLRTVTGVRRVVAGDVSVR